MANWKYVTESEKEYIRIHLLDMTVKEIAEALGRDYWTVHKYKKMFGAQTNHKYTTSEDMYIRRVYGKTKTEYIANKIGVPVMSVYNRAKYLGLRKFKKSKKET